MAVALTTQQLSRKESLAGLLRFIALAILFVAASWFLVVNNPAWRLQAATSAQTAAGTPASAASPVPNAPTQSKTTENKAALTDDQKITASKDPYWGWFGVLAAVLLWLVGSGLTNQWNPLSFALGADNRLSISKLQILLWTGATGFVYVMYYVDRLIVADASKPISDIPNNILIALGISATTTVAAKVIASSQASANPDSKSRIEAPSYNPAALVANDDGVSPNLTKIQMLFWTVVAIAVFLVTAFHMLDKVGTCAGTDASPCFPDISPMLMIFMGLGHATYLGGKLATTLQPSLSSVRTAASTTSVTGRSVTLLGTNLGSSPGCVFMGAANVTPASNFTWEPTAITFDLPAKLDGTLWATGDKATFTVNINGMASSPIVYTYS